MLICECAEPKKPKKKKNKTETQVNSQPEERFNWSLSKFAKVPVFSSSVSRLSSLIKYGKVHMGSVFFGPCTNTYTSVLPCLMRF